jgi:dienelactone hydrolase
VTVTVYDGATHDFDSPVSTRQGLAANRAAKDDVMQRAIGLFDALH